MLNEHQSERSDLQLSLQIFKMIYNKKVVHTSGIAIFLNILQERTYSHEIAYAMLLTV